MIDLAIISANHLRPEITSLFVLGVNRLKRNFGLDIEVFMTGEYHEDFDDIYFIEQQNEPVSEKFNTSLRMALDYDPEYIMVLGSDDIIPNATFANYMENLDVDYLGVTKVIYFSTNKDNFGEVLVQDSSIIVGAGRTFKTSLLNYTKTKAIWHKPMNRSLDSLMLSSIRHHIKSHKIIDGYVIDFKSSENINDMTTWSGLNTDLTCKDVYKMLYCFG